MEKWQKVEPQLTPAWDYKKDKEIEGLLLEVRTNVGPNNSKMYMIKKMNDEVVGVWGGTVLDTRFSQIQIGEEVKVVYLGLEKSPKTGRQYHAFDVFHRLVGEEAN